MAEGADPVNSFFRLLSQVIALVVADLSNPLCIEHVPLVAEHPTQR